MYYTPIDQFPVGNGRGDKSNNRIQEVLMNFYNSNDDYGELFFEHGEYSTSHSLYTGVKRAIQALELPIEVRQIDGGVYIRRTD